MKKKMVNDKVIRAMAIGISAMLAASQPMTAFAEGMEPVQPSEDQNAEQPTQEDNAKAAADKAEEAVKIVNNSADLVKGAAEQYAEVSNEASQADEIQIIEENASKLEENTEAVVEAVENAKPQIDEVLEQGNIIAKSEKEAERKLEAAEQKAEEAKAVVDTATDNVTAYNDAIKTATSIDSANEVYDKIIAEIADADDAVKAAVENYKEIEAEYQKALEDVAIAQKAYEAAAKAGLNDLGSAYDKLKAARENATTIRDQAVAAKEEAKKVRDAALKDAADKYDALLAGFGVEYDENLDKSRYTQVRETSRAIKENDIATAKGIYEQAKTENQEECHAKYAVLDSEKALIEEIQEWQQKITDINNKQSDANYWRTADELVNRMIKYSFYENKELNVDTSSIKVSKWTSNLKEDNCVMVTYKVKGSDDLVTEYYDYIAFDKDGKDAGVTYKTPVSITVVKKTPAYRGEDGTKLIKTDSGYSVDGKHVDDQKVSINEDGSISVTTMKEVEVHDSFKIENKNGKKIFYLNGEKLNTNKDNNGNKSATITGNDTEGYVVVYNEKNNGTNQSTTYKLTIIGGNVIATKMIESAVVYTPGSFAGKGETYLADSELNASIAAFDYAMRKASIHEAHQAADASAKGVYDTAVKTATDRHEDLKKVIEGISADENAAKQKYNDDHKLYEELYKQAEAEKNNIDEAKKAVKNLKDQIKELRDNQRLDNADFASLLISYQSRLNAAETNLKNAQDNLEKLNDEVEKAKANLAATIARLTPAPVRRNNNNNRVPVVQEATPALDFVYAPGAAVAAAPMQMVAGGQPAQIAQDGGNAAANAAQGAGEVFDLGEAATPLADFAEEDETLNGITLQDEATPLVDFEQASHMSWWWLLVVAVLGVTGYELYEKHQKKIEARAEAAKKTK